MTEPETTSKVMKGVADLQKEALKLAVQHVAGFSVLAAATGAVMAAYHARGATWDALAWWGIATTTLIVGSAFAVALGMRGGEGLTLARELAFRRLVRLLAEETIEDMSAAEINAVLDYGKSPSGSCLAAKTLQDKLVGRERLELKETLSSRMLREPRDAEIGYLAQRYRSYTGAMSEMSPALELTRSEVSRIQALARHLDFALRQGRAEGGTLARITTFSSGEWEPRIFAALLRMSETKQHLMRYLFEKALLTTGPTAPLVVELWDHLEQMDDDQIRTLNSLRSSWQSGPLELTRTVMILV